MLLETVLVGIAFFGLFFALMAVRLIFIKGGEFKGTCASQSPFLNNDGAACSLCGRAPEDCENKDDTASADLPAVGAR